MDTIKDSHKPYNYTKKIMKKTGKRQMVQSTMVLNNLISQLHFSIFLTKVKCNMESEIHQQRNG